MSASRQGDVMEVAQSGLFAGSVVVILGELTLISFRCQNLDFQKRYEIFVPMESK